MTELAHGQVWWADLDKVRPVVVLTRSHVANRRRRVVVAPVTTTVRDISTEVALGPAEGLVEHCVVNLDNVQLLPVDRLLRQVGRVDARRWPEVCGAMASMMACR